MSDLPLLFKVRLFFCDEHIEYSVVRGQEATPEGTETFTASRERWLRGVPTSAHESYESYDCGGDGSEAYERATRMISADLFSHFTAAPSKKGESVVLVSDHQGLHWMKSLTKMLGNFHCAPLMLPEKPHIDLPLTDNDAWGLLNSFRGLGVLLVHSSAGVLLMKEPGKSHTFFDACPAFSTCTP